jgi:hypothetical protein
LGAGFAVQLRYLMNPIPELEDKYCNKNDSVANFVNAVDVHPRKSGRIQLRVASSDHSPDVDRNEDKIATKCEKQDDVCLNNWHCLRLVVAYSENNEGKEGRGDKERIGDAVSRLVASHPSAQDAGVPLEIVANADSYEAFNC